MNPRIHGHQSRSLLLPVAVLVAVSCLVATAVWFAASDRPADQAGRDASHSGTSTWSGSVASTRDVVDQVAPRTAPAGGVVIPTGSIETAGYPTGFPPTDLGAVALQVEVTTAQTGFDYDQAVTVAGLYATPADTEAFEVRARDAVALRRQQAGIASDGHVPAPASYAVTPIAYTLERLGADYYAVNLLSYVTLTTAGGDVKDHLYAGTQLTKWVEIDGAGDWRLVQGSSQDIQYLLQRRQPPAVAPGTPGFTNAGWLRIDGASR